MEVITNQILIEDSSCAHRVAGRSWTLGWAALKNFSERL